MAGLNELARRVDVLQNVIINNQKNLEKTLNEMQGSLQESENTKNVVNSLESNKPYTDSIEASCGQTEVIFEDVPDGTLTLSVIDSEERHINYTTERNEDFVTVRFEPLEYVALIKLTIM